MGIILQNYHFAIPTIALAVYICHQNFWLFKKMQIMQKQSTNKVRIRVKQIFYELPRGKGLNLKSTFKTFFKKMVQPRLLFCLFSSFQTNIAILTTNECEKCPSSIQRQDLNSQPSDYESSPLTTRPGLPPKFKTLTSWVNVINKLNQF